MEEKNVKKISLSTCLLILALIVIIVMGVFIFKLYNDKTLEMQKNKDLSLEVSSLNNTVVELQEKLDTISNILNPSNSDSNSLVSKKDESKDWVYDAEYQKNVSKESYRRGNETFYAKDIVVPYINIDSSYADECNKEIKEVFDEAINTYNDGINDGASCVTKCYYEKYVKDDILSIILYYSVPLNDQFYTYNINLKTGEQVSYEELYKIAGFDSSNIDSKVETAITKVMKEQLKDLKTYGVDTGSGGYYPEGTTFDTYNNESFANYKNSIKDNSLEYFLSNDNKLNVVVTLSIPAGGGKFDNVITVE